MFEDILGKQWQIECMGCAITDRQMELPGGIIYETEHFILHQDPANPIPGFLIIALKRHARTFADFTFDEISDFSNILYKTRTALNSIEGMACCTIIQEEKARHFHLWILPHYKWMDNLYDGSLNSILPILEHSKHHRRTPEIIREVLNTAEKIKSIMRDNNG